MGRRAGSCRVGVQGCAQGTASACLTGVLPRDALEGEGSERRPQRRFDRRLQEVAKAVGGGYCRLQRPLKLAQAVRETVAGHRLGALEGGGVPPPLPMHPWLPSPPPPPGGSQCGTWRGRRHSSRGDQQQVLWSLWPLALSMSRRPSMPWRRGIFGRFASKRGHRNGSYAWGEC